MSNKILLIKIDKKSIYTDYTYRCEDWAYNSYSEWKIVNDEFFFRHEGCSSFSPAVNAVTIKNVDKIKKALVDLYFEEEVLNEQ